MSSLDNAVELIHTGRKEEARQILESLIKSEPGNIQAWFWYVETCSTTEKRIQVLEVCLKVNPGNTQVTQALQALRTLQSQRPAQTTPAPPPAQPPIPPRSQTPPPPPTAYSAMYDDGPKAEAPAPSWNTPLYFDDEPSISLAAASAPQQQSTGKQKKPWEMDNAFYEDTSMLSKHAKPPARSYSFYDAWMTVMGTADVDAYENVLNDPQAGAGRAFEWVAYAGIISGLFFPFTLINNPQFKELMSMPEFRGMFGGPGTTTFMVVLAFVMALLTPIFSVIGLAIAAGIQNLLALLFGGSGYYGRTAYALAAYLAPMTILVAVLGVVPFVGQCLTSALGIYNLFLNLRALRAAHSLSVGQALGVMFAPGLLILIFGCLLILIGGFPGAS